MKYLIVQMWLCLLLASAIGFAIGWLWRRRRAEKEIRAARADLRRQLAGREEELRRTREELEACTARLESGATSSSDEVEDHQEQQRLQAELDKERAKIDQLQEEAEQLKRTSEAERARLEAEWREQLKACEERVASVNVASEGTQASEGIQASEGAQDTEDSADESAPLPELKSSAESDVAAETEPPVVAAADLDGPPTETDDLKKIKGIGKVLERFLNKHGIYTYRQIVAWTPADIESLSAELPRFSGRIERDDWIGGARAQHLAKYGEEI